MSGERGQAAGAEFDPATRQVMPEAWVTRVHLLRHGAVERLSQRVVRGQLDVPLSPEGREQSRRLAAWLARHEGSPDVLVGSDLARCSELGEELARRAGIPYAADAALREQHMGSWQGRTWEAVTSADGARVSAYWDDYLNVGPPRGESFADLHERVTTWWSARAEAWRGRRVWVVTHVGVIRAVTCHLLGLPAGEALRLAPATASHTSLLVSGAGAVLTGFGERPWTFDAEPDR